MYEDWTHTDVVKFYKGKQWKSKRKVIMRRDDYKCRHCNRYGKTTEAEMVHHIIPLDTIPDLLYENINLLSLCNSCHGRMHDRTTRVLTDEGLGWVKRIPELKGMWVALNRIKGSRN